MFQSWYLDFYVQATPVCPWVNFMSSHSLPVGDVCESYAGAGFLLCPNQIEESEVYSV